ncbi:Hypothetical protein A7982_11187 [Minicystis rosea]|nr:Hypothetical protein A7982_11187 [Minicystis rosea]
MDYADVLRHLRRSDAEIHSVCRCGSRVYGTAGPASDEDFCVVLTDARAKQDLLFRGGANFVVHGLGSFREALADQSVFALECLFAPAEHRLKEGRPPLSFTLDREKLAASASARSASDFAKAARTFEDEPHAAKKKLFHALRVPLFARQIATRGRLADFTEATPLWIEIAARTETTWAPYAEAYGPLREKTCAEIGKPAKKR